MDDKILVSHFYRVHKERYQREYVAAWARHRKMFQALLKTHKREQLEQLIDFYLTKFVNSYADRCGRSIENFRFLINEVKGQLENAPKEAGAAHPDYERLRTAREST